MQPLTPLELARYEWQLSLPGFGPSAQMKMKSATALVSRCGGLGGPLCYSLAAAGIGRLVLAHAGNLRMSDLNRQILMTPDWIGRPRVECAARRLLEFNPQLEITSVPMNVNDANASELIAEVDIVFDCAPLFAERFSMNRECVRQGKPMVEAAVFGMEAQITTILPGKTACLACLYPEDPASWTRRFPVLGATSAMAASIAALEGIKLLTGIGETLAGNLLYIDAAAMQFRRVPIPMRPKCQVCSALAKMVSL